MQGQVHHYGYVVQDLERAVHEWITKTGAGPFFVMDHVPLDDVTSKGQPATFDHSSAFGQLGTVPVELMQIHQCEPEAVRDGFDQSLGLHHIAWVVASFEDAVARLESLGIPAWCDAHLGEIHFTYQDAKSLLGHHIEVHRECTDLRGFFSMIQDASVDWDGSEPIRSPAG
jgi:catechol 2,3-dioxygenase-like lactoylglutathione lyase family enzyme